MKIMRRMLAGMAATTITLFAANAANAQIFLKSPDFSGAPITGNEAGVVLPLPGATPEETRAGMIWTLRAALNVAALQCQFEPTLLTLNQYNALIADRSREFAGAYSTLTAYFKRTNKAPKAAQSALDQYGTRIYTSFSAVQSQLGFCLTAGRVGRAALFAPPNGMSDIASRRIRELRNSMIPMGEQQFPRMMVHHYPGRLVNLDPNCLDKKGKLRKNCRAWI